MHKSVLIEHPGIVQSIKDGIIEVMFLQQSACLSCQVKGVCNVSDTKDQVVDIPDYSNKYSIGEHVNIVMQESLGQKALFLGYILPFIIVFFILILTSIFIDNELQSGLISLGSLIPYYVLLYKFRDKLKKSFLFKIRKLA